MKYSLKPKSKAPIIVGITLGVIVLVALGIFLVPRIINSNNDTAKEVKNGVNYSSPTNDQQKAGDQAKEDFINKQDQASNGSTEDSGKNVTVSISSSGQNSSTYAIRTIIDTLDDNGTCVLTMKKAGQTDYTQTVGTQILSSYSVCKGFDIPVNNLATGDWQATIKYQSSKGQGSVQQVVTIQ